MRNLLALAALAWTASAHAGAASNPAFLGISMDLNFQGACRIVGVTPASSAALAGLRAQDRLLAIDGTSVANCTQMSALIVQHAPGDVIRLDVLRGGNPGLFSVQATLSSRAEVLHGRFVGRSLDSVDAVDAEDEHPLDLAELRGEPTILAWANFDPCFDCVALVRHIGERLPTVRRAGTSVRLVAVTAGKAEDLAQKHITVALGVPLALVSPRDFEDAATLDSDRVFFFVLDARGIVRFVTPIVPDDDAVDAQIDELLAAAEQAEHARPHK